MLRPARPDDHATIAAVVIHWWGRPLLGDPPRLFLDHHDPLNVVAEPLALGVPGTIPEPAGFLLGFGSPADPSTAYIHFVGVCPSRQRTGLGRHLYEWFCDMAAAQGRARVQAVMSPDNEGAIAFHRALGFSVRPPEDGRRVTALLTAERSLGQR